MNISSKGKYALQLLTFLGIAGGANRMTTLKEVAQSEGLSEKYLWQVASQLKNAGIIKAVPGPRGGFVLAKDPNNVTLAEALSIFEPELFRAPLRHGSASKNTSICSIIEKKFSALDAQIELLLAGATIEELISEHRKNIDQSYSYQI